MNQQQPRLILDPVQVNRETLIQPLAPNETNSCNSHLLLTLFFVAGNCQAGLSSCSWRDPKNYCERLKNAHFQSLQCMERITFLQWWRCIQYTVRVLIASLCLLMFIKFLNPSVFYSVAHSENECRTPINFFPFCQDSHKHCGDLIDHWWGGLCAQTQSCVFPTLWSSWCFLPGGGPWTL